MDQKSQNNLIRTGTPSLQEVKEFFNAGNASTPITKENSSESSDDLSESFKLFLKDAREKKQQSTASKELEVPAASIFNGSIYINTPKASEVKKIFKRKHLPVTANEPPANSSNEIDLTFKEFLNARRDHLLKIKQEEGKEANVVKVETSEENFLKTVKKEPDVDPDSSEKDGESFKNNGKTFIIEERFKNDGNSFKKHEIVVKTEVDSPSSNRQSHNDSSNVQLETSTFSYRYSADVSDWKETSSINLSDDVFK